ncbi:MAG: PilZ domain-containing protein [Pseudomonadales bacterium]
MADEPKDNRRTSVRRQVRLPLGYAAIDPGAAMETLCDALALPQTIAVRARLSDLDDDFARIIVGIGDARTSDALRLLERKVSALEEVVLADLPVPAETDLALSADGIGFESSGPLAVDSWVAIHLVLPHRYHLVAAARVSRCAAPAQAGGPYRIGAEFQGLDGAPARRLTRFTIGREERAD